MASRLEVEDEMSALASGERPPGAKIRGMTLGRLQAGEGEDVAAVGDYSGCVTQGHQLRHSRSPARPKSRGFSSATVRSGSENFMSTLLPAKYSCS